MSEIHPSLPHPSLPRNAVLDLVRRLREEHPAWTLQEAFDIARVKLAGNGADVRVNGAAVTRAIAQ
jgi:hypothetical protein